MSMRRAPPGRTSISQTGLVKPCGPHHRATCRGSVHTWNTSARGAARTRVRTSSRGVSPSFLLVIRLLPGLQLVEVVGQTVEALAPEALEGLDPVVDGLEGLGVEAVEPPPSRA